MLNSKHDVIPSPMHDPMRHHTLITLTAAVCAVAYAEPAYTQETEAEKAKALFDEAMAAHARGEYRAASNLLAKAYAYDNNLVYQYNRVMMLQLNGDYSEALQVLDIYEEPMISDAEGRFKNIPMLRDKLTAQAAEKAEMEEMMAEKKAAEAKDTEGKDPVIKTSEGDAPVAKGPGGQDLEGQEEQPVDEGGGSPAIGYLLIGTGAVAGVTGGLMAAGVFAPEVNESDSASVQWENWQARQSQETASLALIASGAVLVGAGIVYVVFFSGDETDPNTAQNAEPAASLQLAPSVNPGFTGATLLGRF